MVQKGGEEEKEMRRERRGAVRTTKYCYQHDYEYTDDRCPYCKGKRK